MRLLIVSWNYPPKVGGMEAMIHQIVMGLRQTEQVTVIAPFDQAQAGREDQATIRPSRAGLFWYMLTATWQGLRVCRQEPPDIIIGGSALVTPILFLLAQVAKRPFAVIVHGLDLIYKNPLYQWMVRWLLPNATHLVANSQNTKQLAIALGVRPSKVSVIPPGVEVSRFNKMMPPLEQLPSGRKVILSAGRLARRKGIVEFVQFCMPQIVQQCPEVLFLIAGGNPTDALMHKADVKSEIAGVINQHGLESHVQLLGRVDDDTLVALFQQSHLFILPALEVEGDIEGFGIVLIEAAASGKPAVATQVGGIGDAVLNGETGQLVPAGDWQGLQTAVINLLQNNVERERLGQNAQQRATAEFDWPNIIEKYRNKLKSL